MKRILILLLGLFSVAYGQFSPTSAKSAFKWGVSIGTRDSTAYAANDSLVVVINRQGRMMYRSTDGYWKLLANAASSDFVPYTGAVTNVNLGNYRLTARSIKTDSIYANSSAGMYLTTNSGTAVAHWGGGGSVEVDFKGFAGYDANRAGSYTARSFTDKNYVDSSAALRVRYTDTAAMLAPFVQYSDTTGLFGQVVRTFGTQTIGGNKTFSNNITINTIPFGAGVGSGADNIAIGTDALSVSSSTNYSTAVGFSALKSNTGTSNSAFGGTALLANTTGQNNTGIGRSALSNNTDGSRNVAIGILSGTFAGVGSSALTSVNNSTYIGADINGSAATGVTNETVIGYDATGNGSNTVTIGNSSVTDNYFSGNIRGGAFIKSGGLSTQFLKADGSVDGTSYATAASLSGYLPLSAGLATPLTGDLQVGNNSSNRSIRIYGGTAGSSYPELVFYGASSDNSWTIRGNHSTDFTIGKGTFGSYGSTIFTLGATGNVTLTGALNGTSLSMSGGGSFGAETTISRSSNSGSGSLFPRLSISNTLATQGDGSSTFNFADIALSSGNGTVNMFVGTSFAAGTWEPQGRVAVSSNHPLLFSTNNTERGRFASDGTFLINTTTTDGTNKLIVNGGVKVNSDLGVGGAATDARLQVTGNGTGRAVYIQAGASVGTSISIFRLDARAATPFEILGSGAATFSSSVTAATFLTGTTSVDNTVFKLQVGDGTGDTRLRVRSSNTFGFSVRNGSNEAFYIGANTSGGLVFSNDGGTQVASISSTGAATFSSRVSVNGAAATSELNIYATTQPTITFQNAGANRGQISANSSALIYNSLTSSGHNFQIDGVDKFTLAASTGAATFSSSVTATGFIVSSDRRLKNIIKRDGDVAYYKWKDKQDDKVHIGYIAQEVQKTNPDQVSENNGKLAVNYIEILVEKVRALEKEIEQLKRKQK